MSEKERMNLPVVVPGVAGEIVRMRGAVPPKPEATPYLHQKSIHTDKIGQFIRKILRRNWCGICPVTAHFYELNMNHNTFIQKRKHYLDGSRTAGGPDGFLKGSILGVHKQIAFAEHI